MAVAPAPCTLGRVGAVGIFLQLGGRGDDMDVEEAPAARITELMTDPRTKSCTRPRWVAPMTSWVAFSASATCTSAGATSAPTTSTYLPPRSSSRTRFWTRSLALVPVRLSSVRTCTPTSSALIRIAMRAARRIRTALPREPVIDTTTRSLVSHGPAILWRSR